MKSDTLSLLIGYVLSALFLLSGCTTPTLVDIPDNLAPVVAPASSPQDSRDEASGAMLAQTCFGCHGPEGRSGAPAIPSLAGLPENYFIQVMLAYQYGGRHATVMGRIALGYEQDEIARMASYFGHLEFQPHAQRVNWDLVRKGRRLHRRYCRDCHGDLKQASSDGAVRLNGGWLAYLRWTLQDYLIGINQTDAEMSKQLTRLLKRYGSEGLEALLHYYASARP
jgi:sulfide dehydrogenase cytochrome subunit